MQKLKTQLRRLRYFLKKDYLTLSNLGLFAALVVGLFWTSNAISTMTHNWDLQQRLQRRRVEQAKLEIEVETLRLEQAYYHSEEYQEYMARVKQNLMQPGETMVVLPENSEAAKNKYKDNNEKSQLRNNFDQWLEFLFG